jgi:hypothetical protein
LQLAETPCDEPDMGLRHVLRANMEIAGEADTVDHVARWSAPGKQRRQRRTRDCMDDVILAFQPGDQCRANEASGAENSEG